MKFDIEDSKQMLEMVEEVQGCRGHDDCMNESACGVEIEADDDDGLKTLCSDAFNEWYRKYLLEIEDEEIEAIERSCPVLTDEDHEEIEAVYNIMLEAERSEAEAEELMELKEAMENAEFYEHLWKALGDNYVTNSTIIDDTNVTTTTTTSSTTNHATTDTPNTDITTTDITTATTTNSTTTGTNTNVNNTVPKAKTARKADNSIKGKVYEKGKVVVDCEKLKSVLSKSSGKIEIESKDSDRYVTIKNGKSRFKLNKMDAELFPKISCLKAESLLMVNKRELSECINNIAFNINPKDYRVQFKGIHFSKDGKMLRLEACDGKRLGVSTCRLVGSLKFNKDFIVSKNSCIEMVKMLDKAEIVTKDGNVLLLLSQNSIKLIDYGRSLKSLLLEGKYPDVRRIIPKDSKEDTDYIEIDRKGLADSIRKLTLIYNSKCLPLTFKFSKNNLLLRTVNSQHEEVITELETNCVECDKEITFNYKYILDICNVVTGDKIEMRMPKQMTGNSITIKGDNGTEYLVSKMVL